MDSEDAVRAAFQEMFPEANSSDIDLLISLFDEYIDSVNKLENDDT